MTLKEKYESIEAGGKTPYADMGKVMIDNINLFGLGVQPKSDIEAFQFY